MAISDAINGATEPICKLIDAVSGAIGKAYEPRYYKRMADAKAYEIRRISEEIRNNSDLPIVHSDSSNLSVDISDYDELLKRTGKRIAYQEVTKQENIEKIVYDAYVQLSDVEQCDSSDISREWMNRFINSAGDISTEELQILWSKILAGEVVSTNSFSIRTLECLRNMNMNDAKLFQNLCKIVVANKFVVRDRSILDSVELSYDDILDMNDMGLINSSSDITLNKTIIVSSVWDFDDYILRGVSNKECEVVIPQFHLTQAGRELSKIVGEKIDLQTMKLVCRVIANNNKDVIFTLHQVTERGLNNYSYSNIPIEF